MHIGQWHGRSRSWCTAQPGNGMLVLWKFEVTAQRNLWIELLGEISMGWGSGDLLEQTFCKPYCEVLRDIANNLTGGKLSVFIRALSLSFPSAKNKHCSHWMMKSLQPFFIWLFVLKIKKQLYCKWVWKGRGRKLKKPDKRKHLHLQCRFTRSLPKYGVDGCPQHNVVPT